MASPIAQGQAMISTATLATKACPKDGCGPNASQTRKVAAAIAMTTGTNHMVMRLTISCTGSLAPWASSTMRTICDRVVSAPTWVAR